MEKNDRLERLKQQTTRFEVQLPTEANPVPWTKVSVDEVEGVRFLLCRHYGTCLSYAAGEAWIGFTCKFCLVWQKVKGDKANEG